jgi:hypothetical protein
VVVVNGVRVTAVSRTLCDLAAVLTRSRLQHVVETAITARQLTTPELQACAAGWCRQGRPGSASIRALGHLLLDDEPLAASELERRAIRLLDRSGLTGWVLQYSPPWYDGVRGVVDLAWPDHRLVVELDGRRWHATTRAQADDRRRDRLAAANDWITIRFGWAEIVERPGMVIDEICQLLAARGGGGGGDGHREAELR